MIAQRFQVYQRGVKSTESTVPTIHHVGVAEHAQSNALERNGKLLVNNTVGGGNAVFTIATIMTILTRKNHIYICETPMINTIT